MLKVPVWGPVLLCLVIAAGIFGFGFYRYQLVAAELQDTKVKLASTTSAYQQNLSKLQLDNATLTSALQEQADKTNSFATQINQITDTVGTLQKLSKTDKELLQKYSKVYFLNENYIPSALTFIDTRYLYDKTKPLQFHDLAWSFLRDMLEAAKKDGVEIQIISAYRSFGQQAVLKSGYKLTYGAGSANKFSADQGYSEHQLGTAVDLTTPKIAATFLNFDKSDAFTWLNSHAYQYGFILSYPKSNTYYQFEPWHWRFVGIALATKLHNDGKYFYDLDQREIDTYLINIFNN